MSLFWSWQVAFQVGGGESTVNTDVSLSVPSLLFHLSMYYLSGFPSACRMPLLESNVHCKLQGLNSYCGSFQEGTACLSPRRAGLSTR